MRTTLEPSLDPNLATSYNDEYSRILTAEILYPLPLILETLRR